MVPHAAPMLPHDSPSECPQQEDVQIFLKAMSGRDRRRHSFLRQMKMLVLNLHKVFFVAPASIQVRVPTPLPPPRVVL